MEVKGNVYDFIIDDEFTESLLEYISNVLESKESRKDPPDFHELFERVSVTQLPGEFFDVIEIILSF